MREQIASALDLIVHLTRLVDGSRRVSRITEVVGMESDVVTLQDVFVARPGRRADGLHPRRRRSCGRSSARVCSRTSVTSWSANGVVLPDDFYQPERRSAVGTSGIG